MEVRDAGGGVFQFLFLLLDSPEPRGHSDDLQRAAFNSYYWIREEGGREVSGTKKLSILIIGFV